MVAVEELLEELQATTTQKPVNGFQIKCGLCGTDVTTTEASNAHAEAMRTRSCKPKEKHDV